MAEENNMELAKKVFDSLCAALDRRQWRYGKNEERLYVDFGVTGDDIPMKFVILVDAERQMVRAMSLLPIQFSEDKRIDGAIVTCVASFGLPDGSFDYDISTGEVSFRLTATYRDSELGDGLFQHMIDCSSFVVDKYNDKFLAVNKGFMSVQEFIEKE